MGKLAGFELDLVYLDIFFAVLIRGRFLKLDPTELLGKQAWCFKFKTYTKSGSSFANAILNIAIAQGRIPILHKV